MWLKILSNNLHFRIRNCLVNETNVNFQGVPQSQIAALPLHLTRACMIFIYGCKKVYHCQNNFNDTEFTYNIILTVKIEFITFKIYQMFSHYFTVYIACVTAKNQLLFMITLTGNCESWKIASPGFMFVSGWLLWPRKISSILPNINIGMHVFIFKMFDNDK